MRNFKLVAFQAILFGLISCGLNSHIDDYTATPTYDKVGIEFSSILLDTVILDLPAFSGQGFFRLAAGELTFLDRIFNTASIFDHEGNFLKRALGTGQGPGEIPAFRYHGMYNGDNYFLGPSYDITQYSRNWTRTSRVNFLNFQQEKEVYQPKDVDEIGAYDYSYTSLPNISNHTLAFDDEGNIIIPIRIVQRKNPEFNMFGSGRYYQLSKTLGIVDPSSGIVNSIFATKPPVYSKYRFIPNYDCPSVLFVDNSYLMSFPADSMIRVFSKDKVLSYSFGRAGKEMRTDYPEVQDYDGHAAVWEEAQSDFGYYYHIFYDQDNNLLFRSYTKGKGKPGGLQIYKENVLVADFEVPERFSVVGRIGTNYYADGLLDEENDRLGVFVFQLTE